MSQRKTTQIARLQRERQKLVEVLMSQNGITVSDICVATGRKPDTVDKTLAGRFNSLPVIAFLEQKLGADFALLWRDYPNHAA